MTAPYRVLLFALAVLLAAPFAAACSTTPDTPDAEPLELSAAEDLIQTPDVLMAARVNADELSELTPIFQRLAQSSGDPLLRDLADISPDPVGHLAKLHGLPNELPSLDRDQPAYVLVSTNGNLPFFQAAFLGLPTQTEEWPKFLNLRVLLPGADELSGELEGWMNQLLAENRDLGAYEIYEGPGFVRLELAFTADGDQAGAQAWLADLNLEQHGPPASADFRPTPAFDAFVGQDTPFGIWARAEAFTALATLEALEQFEREYNQIGSLGQARFFLTGVSRLATPSAVFDPISAENEDVSLIFAPATEESVTIDVYTTRTARGARIHAAATEPVSLPKVDHPEAFLNLRWQGDFDGVRSEMDKPHWTSVDTGWGDDDMTAHLQGPGADGLALSDGPDGAALLGMFMQYPWTTTAIGSQSMDDFMPVPRAVAIEAFPTTGGHPQIPMGAVIIAAFEHGPDTRAAIEQLLMLGEAFAPGVLDAELVDRDDALLELRLAVNADLAESFDRTAAPVEITSGEFSLNVRAVQQYLQALPAGQAASLFDTIHVRSHGEQEYHALRITVGGDQALTPEPVAPRVDLKAVPTSRCRTEIAAAAVTHLSDLRGDSKAQVEAWAAEVEAIADRCVDASDTAMINLIKERIELARQLADEIP